MDPESFNRLRKESDRAAAVLGAALLDVALGDVFSTRCGARVIPDMLRANGVLGSFSNRIRMAYAIGWIADDTQHDLHLVRSIRNEFAHLDDHTLSFETQSIQDRARELRVLRALEAVVKDAAAGEPLDAPLLKNLERFKPARIRYDIAIMLLSDALAEAKADSPVSTEGAKSVVDLARRYMTNVLQTRPTSIPPSAA